MLAKRLRRRAAHRGLTQDHVNRQRRLALILVTTALIRAAAWTSMIVMYLAGVPFTTSLFKSVAFVAVISLYANAATDFGQGAASLAQLAAADAHHASAREVSQDLEQLEADVARLASLQPGPRAEQLASEITRRLSP